jgi:hypothetical protein
MKRTLLFLILICGLCALLDSYRESRRQPAAGSLVRDIELYPVEILKRESL